MSTRSMTKQYLRPTGSQFHFCNRNDNQMGQISFQKHPSWILLVEIKRTVLPMLCFLHQDEACSCVSVVIFGGTQHYMMEFFFQILDFGAHLGKGDILKERLGLICQFVRSF